MQKKAVSFLLVFLLLISITACQQEKAENPEISAPIKSEEPPKKEDPVIEKPIFPESIVLLDNENFFVEISQFKKTLPQEYTLTFHLENRTDQACALTLDHSAFHDVLVIGLAHVEADAGMTVEETVSFIGGAEDFRVDNITKLEFLLNIYDTETMETICKEPVTFYPFGEENYTPYRREPQPNDQVLLEKDGFQIVLTDMESGEALGLILDLYIVNDTEQNLMFALDEVKINNKRCDVMGLYGIPSQTQSYTAIVWTEAELQEKNITDLTSILLEFYVSNADDWLEDPIAKETVEIIP